MELNYYVSMSLFGFIFFCCYGIELNTLPVTTIQELSSVTMVVAHACFSPHQNIC